jgi:hypothetical protein
MASSKRSGINRMCLLFTLTKSGKSLATRKVAHFYVGEIIEAWV